MPPLKTITATPKVKKSGPALLKKLAKDLLAITGGDQKAALSLAALLSLAANSILPDNSKAKTQHKAPQNAQDQFSQSQALVDQLLSLFAADPSSVYVDDTAIARSVLAPFELGALAVSTLKALNTLASKYKEQKAVFADPLFVASLREALVFAPDQKSTSAKTSPLLPTQFFTPPQVAQTIADQTVNDQSATDKTAANQIAIDNKLAGKTILDPACGGGHLLVPVFFNCLNLSPRDRERDTASSVSKIFADQLIGFDIDQSLVDICKLSLYLAARQVTRAELPVPRITCLPGPAGSLALANDPSDDNMLQVDHIVMNPPYQSTRTIDSATSDYIKTHYTNASGDLYTAFIELALRLLKDGGTLSAITQQSFLTISRYKQFRLELLDRAQFIHYEILGPGVFYFCPGEKVNSVVFTLQKCTKPKTNKIADLCHSIPGNPIVFDAPAELSKIFSDSPKLAEIPGIDIVNGLFTCNNQLFVKDVSLVTPEEAHLYVPYDKGGGKKWYHQTNLRLNWGIDGSHIRDYRAERGQARALPGERFYFKPGVTYSYIGTSGFNARLLSPDSIFDIASSAIFSSIIDQYYILGWLNSSLVIYLLSILNPTVNFQIGDLRRLPLLTPDAALEREVARLASSCVELVRANKIEALPLQDIRQLESSMQRQIDDLIFDHYKIDTDLRKEIANNRWVVNARTRAI